MARVSVLLNLLLLGGMVFLFYLEVHPQGPRAVPAPPPVARIAPQLPPAIQSAPPVVRQEPAPLHWGQLVSTNDYRVFVANLRASGCPEATVEDIVRGDAERVFSMMRERLGVSGTEPGPWSGQAQTRLVAYLLGQTPAAAQEVVSDGGNNEQAGPASMATFLQNVDVTAPGMTLEQAQETANLRQGFLAQNNSLNQSYQSSAASFVSTESSQTAADSTPSPQAAADSTDGTQPSQAGADDAAPRRTQMSQSLMQATAAESILAGLFGAGAATEYDQYQASQTGQQ